MVTGFQHLQKLPMIRLLQKSLNVDWNLLKSSVGLDGDITSDSTWADDGPLRFAGRFLGRPLPRPVTLTSGSTVSIATESSIRIR